jgi:hypothetical protein
MPVVEYTVGMLVGKNDGRADAGLSEGANDLVVVGDTEGDGTKKIRTAFSFPD